MIATDFRHNRSHLILSALAFVAASISILALLLHAAGWLPMYFLLDLLGAPSLVLLLILGIIGHRIRQPVFLNRLVVGCWGGLVATFAYDLVRWTLWQSGLVSFDPFLTHPQFGMMITGLPVETTAAHVVGWAYHFWNGFSFGVMYTLVAGRSHWIFAILWAIALEVGWLTALPNALSFGLDPELIFLSVVGHAGYGITLGAVARQFIRE